MLTRLWTQVRIEQRLFLRDPTTVAFHVCLPLVLLLLLTRVHANMLTLRWSVGVADVDRTPASRAVLTQLADVPGVSIVEDDVLALRRRAAAGSIGAVVVLPAGLENGAPVTVEGESQTGAVVRAILSGVLAERDGATPRVVGPRRVPAPAAAAPAFTAVLLPGVVGMVVASVSLFGFGAGLAFFRQRGFLTRLGVTPLGIPQFLGAQVIHRVLFILVQCGLLVWIGRTVMGATGAVDVVALSAILAAGAVAFLALGFVIGGTAPSGEAATGWCHLLFFPMLLLSGAFYPTAALPGMLRLAAPVLPMTYVLDGLQRSLSGIGGVAGDVAVLLVFATVALGVSVRTFSPE